MKHCASLLLALIPTVIGAQSVDTRDGDTLIAATDLDTRLRGQLLTFFDEGQSHFYNDGRYTYAFDRGQGGYAYGYFEVTGDSVVCVEFVHGFDRCDAYVENDGRLILITAEGQRFPIRTNEDAGPDPLIE